MGRVLGKGSQMFSQQHNKGIKTDGFQNRKYWGLSKLAVLDHGAPAILVPVCGFGGARIQGPLVCEPSHAESVPCMSETHAPKRG